jgi:hypothetical protein
MKKESEQPEMVNDNIQVLLSQRGENSYVTTQKSNLIYTRDAIIPRVFLKRKDELSEVTVMRDGTTGNTTGTEGGTETTGTETTGTEGEITTINENQDLSSVEGAIPVTVGDIIMPLENGLILGMVGLKLNSGLSGSYICPRLAKVQATLSDENVELADTILSIDGIKPIPKRIGITIPVSKQALSQTRGLLESILKLQMPLAVARVVNNWMFNPTAVVSDCPGCFTSPSTSVTFTGSLPTFKDLMNLQGAVYELGVKEDGTGAFVMTETMLKNLSSTSIKSGGDRMIVENRKVGGFVPIFTTPDISDNYVGFGVFSNELIGQFGNIEILVDPYTNAKSDIVNFVLNTNFALNCARNEAFALGKVTV